MGEDHTIRLHRSLIERYGGLGGVRDVGMLHSAKGLNLRAMPARARDFGTAGVAVGGRSR